MSHEQYYGDQVQDERGPETRFPVGKNGQCQKYDAKPEPVFYDQVKKLHNLKN